MRLSPRFKLYSMLKWSWIIVTVLYLRALPKVDTKFLRTRPMYGAVNTKILMRIQHQRLPENILWRLPIQLVTSVNKNVTIVIVCWVSRSLQRIRVFLRQSDIVDYSNCIWFKCMDDTRLSRCNRDYYSYSIFMYDSRLILVGAVTADKSEHLEYHFSSISRPFQHKFSCILRGKTTIFHWH